MNRPCFILSPCGTSLLTNDSSQELRNAVNRHSNTKTEQEVRAAAPADYRLISDHLARVKAKMAAADVCTAQKSSAELNGVISWYGGSIAGGRGDFHQLLCTDTWLGEVTAIIAEQWLRDKGLIAVFRRQKDLRTVDLAFFQSALSDLVQWCENEIGPYRASHHVVFNLTGGFKSIQGFLQTLAQFYADETVYIFETTGELLRLPRLPLRMAAEDVVRQHLVAFRRSNLDPAASSEHIIGIPETMLLTLDGQVCLSPWGNLVWTQTKKTIYSEQVYPPPSDFLKFGPEFEKSLSGLEGHRKVMVNERIDDLVRHLEEKQTGKSSPHNPPSLDFKRVKGNSQLPSTHECDAWADQDAKRLFGHFEGDRFVLDRLARALH